MNVLFTKKFCEMEKICKILGHLILSKSEDIC